MNRYEFAVIIQKALVKYNKASEANKQLIDKLTAEFAAELNKMEVRIASLEERVGTVKVSGGEIRQRYEWTKNPGPNPNYGEVEYRQRARLFFDAKIDKGIDFHSVYEAESGKGDGKTPPDTYPGLVVAFLQAKAGKTDISLGRLGMGLGQGTLAGAP